MLGEGGMGRIYEVRHAALDRRFAMKVLRRDLAQDAELAARFILEAKATASVQAPERRADHRLRAACPTACRSS